MDTKKTFFLKKKNYAIKNKIPVWKFGVENFYLVVCVGILYTDLFILLTSYIFTENLCLHKSIYQVEDEFNMLNLDNNDLKNFNFFNSGLTPKNYYLKYISIYSNYGKFLQSALLYYLKFSIKNNELSRFMYLFSQIMIANKTFTLLLYKDMLKLNIFSVFTLECLNGFFYYFIDLKIIWELVFKTKNEFLTTEKNHVIFRFMHVFSFYFSPKFRSTCFADCLKSNSYIPMFLALKIYQIKLSAPKLTLSELKKINIISSFKEKILNYNIMSKESIDYLIEKNCFF